MARFDFAIAGDMALSNGLGDTLFQLGMAASTIGEGAPDLVAAHKWFNLAALQGNEDAATYRQEGHDLIERLFRLLLPRRHP